MSIEVQKSGLLTTLQDLGRIGHAHLGVSRSGAFDAPALCVANIICGNPRDACGLEITILGPTLHFNSHERICITGAPISVQIDGHEACQWMPLDVPRGAYVTIGTASHGCRSYLAVHGGIDVEPVLGSRSTDVNAALGPSRGLAVRTGDVMNIGHHQDPRSWPARTDWHFNSGIWFRADTAQTLRLLPGRHQNALSVASRSALFESTFRVHTQSNRTGLRLEGPLLQWKSPIEIVSEGCVPGVLQLPPSGNPIIFGVECPTIGGYPRIGQIAAVDLPRVAQLRPGDTIQFLPCTYDVASRLLQELEKSLNELEYLANAMPK